MITEYERERLQKDKVNINQQKPEVNILIRGKLAFRKMKITRNRKNIA